MRNGYWLLDAGYWILDTGYWILDIGCSILEIFPAYSNKDAISTIAIAANCEDKDGIQIPLSNSSNFLISYSIFLIFSPSPILVFSSFNDTMRSHFRLPTPVFHLPSSSNYPPPKRCQSK